MSRVIGDWLQRLLIFDTGFGGRLGGVDSNMIRGGAGKTLAQRGDRFELGRGCVASDVVEAIARGQGVEDMMLRA